MFYPLSAYLMKHMRNWLKRTRKDSSTVNDYTTIRMQTLARNQATILAGQEDKASSNLRWLPRSTHRRAAELVLSVFLHGRRDKWCPDWAWAHSIHTDAVRYLLVMQTAGEGDDGAFRACVIKEIRATDVGVDGGAVDDRVARFHVCESVFGKVEVGVDVCVEGFEPLIPLLPVLALLSIISWGRGRKLTLRAQQCR